MPSIRVRGTLASDFGALLMHAAIQGHGISVHPYDMVSEHLGDGRLVAVLPEHQPDAHEIYVIYSSRQNLPERVRRFVALLRERAQTPPQWSLPRQVAGRVPGGSGPDAG